MTIDGIQKISIKNENPQKFENVKIYAGDDFHEAADAEIRSFKACPIEEGLIHYVQRKYENLISYISVTDTDTILICNKTEACYEKIEDKDTNFFCLNLCPPPNTTITEKECFCGSTNTSCSKDQICNSFSNNCTAPYEVCPEYPETLSNHSECLCQGKSVCNKTQLCSNEGECRSPVECPDPTNSTTLNLEIKTENANLTESQNITIGCQKCHYWSDFSNIEEFDITCNANGNWSREITVGCTKLNCNGLSIDADTVDIVDDDGCYSTKLKCKNFLNSFEFSSEENELLTKCTPR